MSKLNITIRHEPEQNEKIKELATALNTTTSQVYKWLVDASLQIVNDESDSPELPPTLSLMRGIKKGNRPKLKGKET